MANFYDVIHNTIKMVVNILKYFNKVNSAPNKDCFTSSDITFADLRAVHLFFDIFKVQLSFKENKAVLYVTQMYHILFYVTLTYNTYTT